MSLATRCTACGTVFRVVQDQLRVSEGWVRCGRCAEVFNAVENLVDPPLSAAGHATAGPGAAMARMGSSSAPRAATADDVDLPLDTEAPALPAWARSDLPDNEAGRQAMTGPDQDLAQGLAQDMDTAEGSDDMAARRQAHRDAGDATTARQDAAEAIDDGLVADPDDRYGASSLLPSGFEPSVLPAQTRHGDRGLAATATGAGGAAEPASSQTTTAAAAAAAQAAGQALPSFVRRADRAARWQQPRVRAALAALVLLGVLGLLVQAAHSYRDLLAARWPAAQPLLAQACSLLGCTVQPPRLIDALVVDSSGLLRVERSNVYKLAVTLRNRDALAVALPALDLSLTDTQGRLVSRRVLRMAELGQTQASLAPGAELLLQATLQTADNDPSAGVAGYTIDLFYP